ncbi:MAG TPA: acyclic terpene utilization AtuA family protein [Bacteroidota bacterium]|nr:acyclic terpene utilization AtuA family protein [Bacteroidota bacterium]
MASGQGFWGDLQSAPFDQVTKGPIDYLMMDFLAELTMSILQKQKQRNPEMGYARDLVSIIDHILPVIVEKNIRVVTNGGGVNPMACRDAIFRCAEKRGIRGLKIGVVSGDDILGRLDTLRDRDIHLDNMETGEPFGEKKHRFQSANVYFGARPIVEALEKGAQIVITGRSTDTALTYAPMIHEFGWAWDDWDKLAAGVVAGHILECGGQATGGNYAADWRSVPDLAHLGFPIAEAYPDGEIVITKHEDSGGLVTVDSVSEQLMYEIGDPSVYITPECIADFTSIHLAQEGKDRVKISGVRGKPGTQFYKVSMSYSDGYNAVGTLTYAWPDALEKAKKADEILRTRLADQGLHFDEIRTEFLGYNACHGPIARAPDVVNEVVLRVGVRSHDHRAVEQFGKAIAPLILTGPPAVTGFAGGRPKPNDVVAYWPALLPKEAVRPQVLVTHN